VTNWTEFYFMCGSAAAGLTGLMFIAVTFGARLITNEKLPYVEAFFSPISDHFMQVFILCAVALIPIAGAKTLGGAILITTVFRFAQLAGTYRLTKVAAGESEDIELSDWILGIYLPAVVYLCSSRRARVTSSGPPPLPASLHLRCSVSSSSRYGERGKCSSGSPRKLTDRATLATTVNRRSCVARSATFRDGDAVGRETNASRIADAFES
jgi:hypothetical protein